MEDPLSVAAVACWSRTGMFLPDCACAVLEFAHLHMRMELGCSATFGHAATLKNPVSSLDKGPLSLVLGGISKGSHGLYTGRMPSSQVYSFSSINPT